MAKADTTKVHKPHAPREVELEPDAWPRFEQFIRDIAKAGPQHRTAKSADRKKKARPQR
jgi:hypothetical protein